MRPARAGALVLVLAAAAPAAWADEPPAETPHRVERTDEVEVRAAAPAEEEIAAFATRIDPDQAQGRGEDLADLLRSVPGALVRSYAGLGRYASVSLRGSSAEQVTVLVDGIPLNRAFGGAVDLSTIPVTEIESVTVFRGMPPAASGSSGMGGVIDLRTRQPPDGARAGLRAQLDLLLGSLDTRRLSGSLAGGLGRGRSWRIGIEHIDSVGAFTYPSGNGTPHTTEDDGIFHRTNNKLDSRAVRLGARLGQLLSGQVDLQLNYRHREQGLPGLDVLPTPYAQLDEQQVDSSLSWTWRPDKGLDSVELLADLFRREDHTRDRFSLDYPVDTHRFRNLGGGLAVLLRNQVGRHGLMGRADLRHESARAHNDAYGIQDRGGARRTLAGMSFEDRIAISRVLLIPSVRVQWRSDDLIPEGGGPSQPTDGPNARARVTGKIGVAWQWNPRWVLRGSVGHFQREPSLLELFGDQGFVRGNQDLRPETGDRMEIGFSAAGEFQSRAVGGEVVLHATEASDLIVLEPQAQGILVPQNIAEARVFGVEASGNLALNPVVSLNGSVSWIRTENRSGGFADGKRLPLRPDAQMTLGMRWNPRPWRISYDYHYVGANYTDRFNDPALRLPARSLHDLHLAYEFSGGGRVGFEIRNLLDQKARDVARYPLPGRTAYLHFGWRWEETR